MFNLFFNFFCNRIVLFVTNFSWFVCSEVYWQFSEFCSELQTLLFACFYHVAIRAMISDIDHNSNVFIASASIVEWVGVSTLLTVDDNVLVVRGSSAPNMRQQALQIF